MKSKRAKTNRLPQSRVPVETDWNDPSFLSMESDSFWLPIQSSDLEKGVPDDKYNCPIVHAYRRTFKLTEDEGIQHGLIVTKTVAWLPMRDKASATGWIRLRFKHYDGLVALVDGGITPDPRAVHFLPPSASHRPGYVRKTHRETRLRRRTRPHGPRRGGRVLLESARTGEMVEV